jgi:hypothetical protein
VKVLLVVNLKKKERHTGFHLILELQIRVGLQHSLVGSDMKMLHSVVLRLEGVGGVQLQRVQVRLGIEECHMETEQYILLLT